jgi:hypothetical protein
MRVSLWLSCVACAMAVEPRSSPREFGARTAACCCFLRNSPDLQFTHSSLLNKLDLFQSTHAYQIETLYPCCSRFYHTPVELLSLSFGSWESIRNPQHVIATSISSFSRDVEHYLCSSRCPCQSAEGLGSLMSIVPLTTDLQAERCLSPIPMGCLQKIYDPRSSTLRPAHAHANSVSSHSSYIPSAQTTTPTLLPLLLRHPSRASDFHRHALLLPLT